MPSVFLKLDAKSGFHQVRLSESCQELTTFITPFGRYCYRRLPFGITSAPEVFQRQMSWILEGLEGCVNMVDDILVFGRDRSEHDSRLQAVLRKLEQAGITLNASKCSFGVSSVKFLGVVVSATGISADPDKVSAIVNMKPPTDTQGVRRFLGMLNHIGRFLPNLSAVTTPIRLLLNKNAVWTWDQAQATSFETLKRMVASNACMASYNPELPTLVSADASSFGLGAVLLQEQQTGERRAVAFASRALTTAEQRYSQIEKEALGVSWAIERFEEFLRGLSFVVETDHQPLVRLLGSADLDLMPPRIQRFRIRLMRYQFTVKYVPGKYLATADTLSRDPECSSTSKVDSTEIFVSMVVAALPSTLAVRLEDFRSHQTSDGECSMLKAYSMKGWPRRDRLPLNMTRYWEHRGDFTICEDLLFMGGRLVVPEALRRDIVNLLHDGHQGVNRCLAVARDSVWWPGLNSQVKAAVENCPACASTRVQRCEPMIPTETPSAPWERVAIDLFHFANQDFLVVVDYRSRYPEVITLRSTSADAVISAIKSTFARHGIPVTVVSDNGPQFSCKAFEDFGKTYGFTHVTSSPRYPQSNGEAERMVRTIKELFLKATDPFLALLAYRNTPGVSGYSPAQLLMGRSLRTRVPATAQSLVPDWPQVKEFNDRDAAQRRRQQRDYNNRHAAHDLRALDDGEEVWVRDTRSRATVLSPAQRPRSYIVQTPSGILVRNRRHLVPCSNPQSAPSDDTGSSNRAAPISAPSPGPQRAATGAASDTPAPAPAAGSPGHRCTRYGRRVVPPRRLDL